MKTLTLFLCALLCTLTATGLAAQEPAATTSNSASAGALATGLPGNPIAEILLALIGILALICVIAWLVKRFSGLNPHGSQHLKTIAVMPLGSRERIAVLQIGERQIVVGITPSHITTLLELDKPLDIPAPRGEFARKLQSLMHRDQDDAKGEANGVQKQP